MTIRGCNENCNCTLKFSPVCAEDGVTVFYSPCYAGCKEAKFSDKSAVRIRCFI